MPIVNANNLRGSVRSRTPRSGGAVADIGAVIALALFPQALWLRIPGYRSGGSSRQMKSFVSHDLSPLFEVNRYPVAIIGGPI
jgi:hypothetical protein